MSKTDMFEVIEILSDVNELNEIYKLDWATRDEIIVNLNRYTQLLCGEKTQNETLMYDNADLYQILIGLPVKSPANSESTACAPPGSRQASKVVLDLDTSSRLQIVSTLIANHSLVVDVDSASEESKQKMIERNNKLIVKLVNLPFNLIAGSADESSVLKENNNVRLTKRSEFADKMARLKKLADDKQLVLIEQTKKINYLYIEIDKLAKAPPAIKRITGDDLKQVVEMLSGKVDIGLTRKKVDFEYELQGVDAFLESGQVRYSEYFFTKHLAWYLAFKVTKEVDQRYLSLYLYSSSHTGGHLVQPVKATFDLSLLNQAGGKAKSYPSTSNFGTPTLISLGLPKFISLNDLKLGGYIKNNKLKVRVNLEVHDPLLPGY